VSRAHLLLAVIDGGGNVPPALAVAAELARRGHQVRVLADPTVESSARAAGCEFTPWTSAPHFDTLADQTAAIGAAEHGSPRQRLRVVSRFAGGRATRGFACDVLAAARTGALDGVLVDAALPGLLIGAEASGLPCAGLMANLYLRPTRGLPPLGTAWSPGEGRLGRLRDALALGVVGLATEGLARPLNAIRAEYGLAPVGDVFEQLDHLARVLVLSSAGFDFPTPLPPNVRYVGPQLDDPDWAAGGDDWRPDGDGPLVLVAMSSIYQRQSDLLGTVASALGSMPVRGVITTGRAVRPDAVPAPGNVRVVRSAPHHDVLREASVVVTHAGHGTTIKTLAAGVPLVCIPMGRDQHANTTRVLRLGAGVRVGRRSSARRITAAVQSVLDQPAFTANARQVAQMLATEAATNPTAADEIEAIVGTTSAHDT
jgi:UDP:flavonoid glycosyltransferase YjiC (YdhE family)